MKDTRMFIDANNNQNLKKSSIFIWMQEIFGRGESNSGTAYKMFHLKDWFFSHDCLLNLLSHDGPGIPVVFGG
jgi:hypothetical protein